METTILEEIGLTKNQAKVYLALLKLGSATAQQIMKEANMHRSPVYDALENLQQRGLAGYVIKDFKKYFQSVSPEKLYLYVDEKKEALAKAMPELKKLEESKKEEIQASIYKGKEGLKTLHYDILREGKEVLVLGAKGLIFSELPYFIPQFERERIKKKIRFTLLYDKKETKKQQEDILRRKLFSGRTLPKGFDSKGVVNIFGKKIVIVLWKEKYPSAFLIENKEIADAFRKWFQLLWKTTK